MNTTAMALLLKPIIAPLVLLALYLPARCGLLLVARFMPAGRLKSLLVKRIG